MATNMKLWWALLVLQIHFQHIVNAKRFIEFLQWDNCRASDATGIYRLENPTFGLVSPAMSEFNATFVIGQDFEVVIIKFKFFVCKSMSDADCELFVSILVPDHCKKMTEKGQFYSIMADSSNPPITCPFKKGAYHITHAQVPIETIKNLPFYEDLVYKIEWVFEYHGKRIGCWIMKARISRVRDRKKNNGKE